MTRQWIRKVLFSIMIGRIEISLPLCNKVTVSQTEVYAIMWAVDQALDMNLIDKIIIILLRQPKRYQCGQSLEFEFTPTTQLSQNSLGRRSFWHYGQ